jgi:hypothetical protein
MKRKTYSLFALIIASTAITGAYAWWVIQYVKVNYCYDTDGGIDFLTQGTINIITLKGINRTYTDYCIDNITIGEYVCSNNLVGQPPGYAALIGEDCSIIGNVTSCVAGRCV